MVLALAAMLAATVAIGRAGSDPVVATVPIDRNQMAWRPVLDTRTGRAFFWPLNAGSVRVLDVSTGTFLKGIAIDSAPMVMVGYDLVVNEQLDRVFAVSVPTTGSTPFVGDVIALDARTGRLLYRTPLALGGTMSLLVVDARAHATAPPGGSYTRSPWGATPPAWPSMSKTDAPS